MTCNGEAQGRALVRHTSSHQHIDQHGNKTRLNKDASTHTHTGIQDPVPTITGQGILLAEFPFWILGDLGGL